MNLGPGGRTPSQRALVLRHLCCECRKERQVRRGEGAIGGAGKGRREGAGDEEESCGPSPQLMSWACAQVRCEFDFAEENGGIRPVITLHI